MLVYLAKFEHPRLGGIKPFQSELGGITSQPQQGEIIDVAHEALIRNWQLLREWLNESRDNLRKQRKFNTLAQEWQNQARKADYLLTGKRLKEAKDFHQENGEKYPLSSLTISFIKASSQNRLKSLAVYGIIPLIVVTIGTYLGFREYQIQSYLNLLRDCPKPTENQKGFIECEGRINALEKLTKAKRLPRYINLNHANLDGANLYRANLTSANLYRANLSNANLTFANLSNANLYRANLIGANLDYADLIVANLDYAYLQFADLSDANLDYAKLKYAKLKYAKLKYANLTDAKNLTNQQIKSACYWEKAYFAKRWDNEKREWVFNDVENKKRIAEIKADKSSDPETPVDCSRWE